MKCEKHPEADAVGICVACGRGVCPICKLFYNNLVHCKDCVEAGRIGSQRTQQYTQQYAYPGQPGGQYPAGAYPGYPGYGYPPYYPYAYPIYRVIPLQPKPIGTPSKHFFGMGKIGCFISGMVSMLLAVLSFPSLLFTSDAQSLVLVVAIGGLLVALMPVMYGTYGLYINYGTSYGLYSAITLVVGAALLFIFTIIAAAPLFMGTRSGYYTFFMGFLWLLIGSIAFGTAAIVMGGTLDHVRRYIDPSNPAHNNMSRASGAFIVAGMFFVILVGWFIIGWVILAIALFFYGLAFDNAPIPPVDAEQRGKDDFFITPPVGGNMAIESAKEDIKK